MLGRLVLDTLVTGLPLVIVFLGIYTVFRLRSDFDLTVEGSFALGGAATAVALIAGVDPTLALLVGAAAGALAGLATALLHLTLGVQVLLAGLVMSIGLFSVTLHVLGAPTVGLLSAATVFDGGGDARTVLVLAAVVLVVLGLYLLFLRTEIGLALRASGVNPRMARSQGVDDRAMTVLALVLANGLAGLGAGLVVQTQGYADVNMGIGTFVGGVGAILLGELLLRPSGSAVLRIVACVLAGTLLYRLILTGALRVGLPAADLKGVTALTLIIAVAAHRYLGGGVRWLTRSRRERPTVGVS
ncbi:ABC transporter permease [Pseudonocardia sp. NPDC049154]|uniref:ABC transporter permease subunit n=1 Tax=Pseudonocardia sp. NPDC049154 TaxID=3155501 RepID=UPI0033E8B994